MAKRIPYIPNRVIDTNGISDGASIYVYQTGTTTPVSIYSDEALTTPLSNPLVVDAGAPVPVFYHNESGDIRVQVVENGGAVVSDDDPFQAPVLDRDLASTATGKGAALVGFKRTDTGAVARTVQARLADIRTAKDFGAVADKTVDSSAAIQAAIDAGATTIPPGDYGLASGIAIGSGQNIIAEGVTFYALANNLTFITAASQAYFTRIIGLNLRGNGFTNVTGYDLTNFRLNTYISGNWEDIETGVIYRSGSFGSILENVATVRVPYPVKVLANNSGLMILNPQFDNGATVSGTGAGTGIEIQSGDVGSGVSNIGVIVQGGFIQGFTNGITDAGWGTKATDTYYETNANADISADGARLSHYRGNTHFGPTGAAAYKLRNTDGIKIEAPIMASGARTALYDIDSSNTNTVELREKDANLLNEPTGSLTYVNRIAVQSTGTFSPTIIGSGTAGAGTYTTQSGKWTKTGDRVLVEVEVTWTAHTGTGNIIIGGIPAALNPTSYTPRRMGPVIAPGVAIAGPHAYAYLNGSGGQATLVEVSGAGAQALVALPSSGTIYFTIEYSV